MRFPQQGHFKTTNGMVVPSGAVSVYYAGTTTLVPYIYAAKTGGAAITTGQVLSDASGKYIFYVDDKDYSLNQTFKIVFSKSNPDYITQTYDNVSILPPVPANTYYADPNAADQGATVNAYSVKSIIDLVAGNNATLILRNCSGSVTTSYSVATALTIPATVELKFEIGARFSKSGSGTVTITGPLVGNPMHQIFSGFTASYNVSTGFWEGDIHFTGGYGTKVIANPLWFGMTEGGSGDGATVGPANHIAWATMMASLPSANAFPTIEIPYGLYWIAGDAGATPPTGGLHIDRPCVIYWNNARFRQYDTGAGKTTIMIGGKGTAQTSNITIYDGPNISMGAEVYATLSSEGIGISIRNVQNYRIHNPQAFGGVAGISIYAQGVSTANGIIYEPILQNNLRNFFVHTDAVAGSSVNNVNVIGGFIENNSASSGVNVRLVELDGTGTTSSDGINFWGTIIQNQSTIGYKALLTDVNNCHFNAVYWDGATPGATADIAIDSNCVGTIIDGGATLSLQIINDNGIDTEIRDPSRKYFTWSLAGGTATYTMSVKQYNCGILVLTDLLTVQNIAVIFPTNKKQWIVFNNTTGAFTVTCKTISGSGIVIAQGKTAIIFGDGTNILRATADV